MERLISLQPYRMKYPFLVKVEHTLQSSLETGTSFDRVAVISVFPCQGCIDFSPLPVIKDTARAEGRLQTYAMQSVDRYKKLISQKVNVTAVVSLPATIYPRASCIISEYDMPLFSSNSFVNRVREKLVAELATIPEPVTDKSLRDLPYLNQVINGPGLKLWSLLAHDTH
jgi:hypothetical protein